MVVEPPSDVAPIAPVDQTVLSPIRPRASWYVVGTAVIVLSLVGGFGLLTSGAFGYLHAIDDLARIDVPGEATVELDPGTVIVYHEPAGGPPASLDALDIVVLGPGGEPVAVEGVSGDDRYLIEGRRGIAVGELEAQAEGGYRFEVRGEAPGELAIGPSPRRRLGAFGRAAVALAAVGVIVGVVVLVVARRRRAAARAARLVEQQARRVERLA